MRQLHRPVPPVAGNYLASAVSKRRGSLLVRIGANSRISHSRPQPERNQGTNLCAPAVRGLQNTDHPEPIDAPDNAAAMTKNTDHSENADGSNSTEETTIAETIGVVRSALARLEDDADEPSCQAHVEETGYYVLEDPSNGEAWIKTQDIEEVRC